MKLGMKDTGTTLPDIYGLPVFRVNLCIKQRAGNEIHVLMGQSVLGQTVWSHIEIWSIEDVLRESGEFNQLARISLCTSGVMPDNISH